MKTILAEFGGNRVGFFRPKPIYKTGKNCKLCGSGSHIGKTTCDVKTLTIKTK